MRRKISKEEYLPEENIEILFDLAAAYELGYTATEAAFLSGADEETATVVFGEFDEVGDGVGPELEVYDVAQDAQETAKDSKNRGPRRGHFSKNVKHDLASQGKLNAKKKMPREQKLARRKKRRRK